MKKNTRISWLVIVVCSVTLMILFPEYLHTEKLAELKVNYGNWFVALLLILFVFRGILLIPPTVLIITAVLLFPHRPIMVFFLSIIGSYISCSIVYWLGKYLDFGENYRKKYPRKYHKAENGLNKYGFGIVTLWALLPFTPTDLICYLAGTFRMNFLFFSVGLILGKIVLVSLYVFGGSTIFGALL